MSNYEYAYFDSIAGQWVVCGPQIAGPNGEPDVAWQRAATPEEAAELEGASEYLHQEYLALESVA